MYKVEYGYKGYITKIVITGEFSMEEALELTKELSQNPPVKKKYIYTDARKAKYTWDIEDIKYLSKEISAIRKNKTEVYEAILISEPEEHALTSEYDRFREASNYTLKIFYTEEAALHWLMGLKD